MLPLDILKPHESSYSCKQVCKQKIVMSNFLKKNLKIKAFIILFYNFFLNAILNENGKVVEETLAVSNSVAVKTTLRGLRYFKITLPLLQKISRHCSVIFSHTVENISQ